MIANPQQTIDREFTPARSVALAISELPDVPGMGGLSFQDEDPLWMEFVRAQDARRGYEHLYHTTLVIN
jgi:hypothetical protein